MKKYIIILGIAAVFFATIAFAATDHSTMHHEHQMVTTNGQLTEAGNDAFGTIQEVIKKFNADPNTDWTKVNLEALRQHLLDMNDMTLNVDVISQKKVEHGLEAIIKPTTTRAALALARVFKAHPAQLQRETGWHMVIVKQGQKYILTTTSPNKKEADKIRGLGYIGLMAYGNHHQFHHWAMATGKNPHGGHH